METYSVVGGSSTSHIFIVFTYGLWCHLALKRTMQKFTFLKHIPCQIVSGEPLEYVSNDYMHVILQRIQ